jgi:ABC-type protease/lipase transport system fused ATPase/permease subunit
MAVNKPQKFAKDFWPYYHRVVALVIIFSQVVTLVVLAAILYMLEVHEENMLEFVGILAAEAILGTVTSLFIYSLVSQPLMLTLSAAGLKTFCKPSTL